MPSKKKTRITLSCLRARPRRAGEMLRAELVQAPLRWFQPTPNSAFALAHAVMGVFVYFYVLETQGRSLEDVDRLFAALEDDDGGAGRVEAERHEESEGLLARHDDELLWRARLSRQRSAAGIIPARASGCWSP